MMSLPQWWCDAVSRGANWWSVSIRLRMVRFSRCWWCEFYIVYLVQHLSGYPAPCDFIAHAKTAMNNNNIKNNNHSIPMSALWQQLILLSFYIAFTKNCWAQHKRPWAICMRKCEIHLMFLEGQVRLGLFIVFESYRRVCDAEFQRSLWRLVTSRACTEYLFFCCFKVIQSKLVQPCIDPGKIVKKKKVILNHRKYLPETPFITYSSLKVTC